MTDHCSASVQAAVQNMSYLFHSNTIYSTKNMHEDMLKDTVQLTEMNHVSCSCLISVSTGNTSVKQLVSHGVNSLVSLNTREEFI